MQRGPEASFRVTSYSQVYPQQWGHALYMLLNCSISMSQRQWTKRGFGRKIVTGRGRWSLLIDPPRSIRRANNPAGGAGGENRLSLRISLRSGIWCDDNVC